MSAPSFSSFPPSFSSFPDLDPGPSKPSSSKRDEPQQKDKTREKKEKERRDRDKRKSDKKGEKRRRDGHDVLDEERRRRKKEGKQRDDDDSRDITQPLEPWNVRDDTESKATPLFYSDRTGDPLNITYGGLHAGDVPKHNLVCRKWFIFPCNDS